MTEQEWSECADPRPMLTFLRGRVSERKLRLFACACVRRVWHLLTEGCRHPVVVAERFADGRAGLLDLEEANCQARNRSWPGQPATHAAFGSTLQSAARAAWAAWALRNRSSLPSPSRSTRCKPLNHHLGF